MATCLPRPTSYLPLPEADLKPAGFDGAGLRRSVDTVVNLQGALLVVVWVIWLDAVAELDIGLL